MDPADSSRRTLADPLAAFGSDDGSAPPQLRALLEAAASSDAEEDYLRAVAGLCAHRLLTPIVASGEDGAGGTTGEKVSEMSTVILAKPSGERAMLAFTGVDAVQSWHPQARPVPATLDRVAQTALQSEADAVLIDLAGPHPLVLERALLDQLARSRRLVELAEGGFGWAEAVR